MGTDKIITFGTARKKRTNRYNVKKRHKDATSLQRSASGAKDCRASNDHLLILNKTFLLISRASNDHQLSAHALAKIVVKYKIQLCELK